VRESIRIVLMTDQRERIPPAAIRRHPAPLPLRARTRCATRRRIQDQISVALARWEPRVAVQSIEVEADANDRQAAVATIVYRLVATQSVERVSLKVTLAR
jgi:phage baseplate assembly protein W